MVKRALFLSSSQSPAIKRNKSRISRSAVSKFLGNSCFKKPEILSWLFCEGFLWGGWGFGAGQTSGAGGDTSQLSATGIGLGLWTGAGDGALGTGSGIRFF